MQTLVLFTPWKLGDFAVKTRNAKRGNFVMEIKPDAP
jgi:hypothetical protein